MATTAGLQQQQPPQQSRRYLTFNPALQQLGADLSLAEDASEVLEEQPLQNEWQIWEQLESDSQKSYSESMKPISGFASVQDFWRMWNLLPQPSQLMANKRMVREGVLGGPPQLVDAIMIFRDNVQPMWEDELNAHGGHFEIRYPQTYDSEEQARLDEHWNKLVLGIVGATIEPVGMVTGVRLVDKLHASGRGGFLRIEVWFTDIGVRDGRNLLKCSIEDKLFTKLDGTKDQSVRPIITFKTHQKNR